ncbi:transposable element Tcb2 transposase [Trichonephila clavipes]|nr:transposable element Tcb2 transposase [Trichonephila clavipes]
MVCVRLTSRHRRDRREWATEHVNWRRNEWSNVLFSDESRFSVHPDNRRIFIWRDRGSRNNPAFVRESVRVGGVGVFEEEILRPIVVPYAAAIGDDFILMDNNCRPHCANLVEDFLFEEEIVRMEWPACSPDMNPIQHVWDALGRRVAGHQPPRQTLQELERALLEEWDRIPQLMINSFIDSMPQRNDKERISDLENFQIEYCNAKDFTLEWQSCPPYSQSSHLRTSVSLENKTEIESVYFREKDLRKSLPYATAQNQRLCIQGVQKSMRLPYVAKVDVVDPGRVIAQSWITWFRLQIDRENKQTKETIQSNG